MQWELSRFLYPAMKSFGQSEDLHLSQHYLCYTLILKFLLLKFYRLLFEKNRQKHLLSWPKQSLRLYDECSIFLCRTVWVTSETTMHFEYLETTYFDYISHISPKLFWKQRKFVQWKTLTTCVSSVECWIPHSPDVLIASASRVLWASRRLPELSKCEKG